MSKNPRTPHRRTQTRTDVHRSARKPQGPQARPVTRHGRTLRDGRTRRRGGGAREGGPARPEATGARGERRSTLSRPQAESSRPSPPGPLAGRGNGERVGRRVKGPVGKVPGGGQTDEWSDWAEMGQTGHKKPKMQGFGYHSPPCISIGAQIGLKAEAQGDHSSHGTDRSTVR